MSVRRTILRAISEATDSAVPAARKATKKKRRRTAKHDIRGIFKEGGGWTDISGGSYKRYTVNGKSYMRRSDGVWYKPIKSGDWQLMSTPPKGGERLHAGWQTAKGAAGVAAVGIGLNEAHRAFRK